MQTMQRDEHGHFSCHAYRGAGPPPSSPSSFFSSSLLPLLTDFTYTTTPAWDRLLAPKNFLSVKSLQREEGRA